MTTLVSLVFATAREAAMYVGPHRGLGSPDAAHPLIYLLILLEGNRVRKDI